MPDSSATPSRNRVWPLMEPSNDELSVTPRLALVALLERLQFWIEQGFTQPSPDAESAIVTELMDRVRGNAFPNSNDEERKLLLELKDKLVALDGRCHSSASLARTGRAIEFVHAPVDALPIPVRTLERLRYWDSRSFNDQTLEIEGAVIEELCQRVRGHDYVDCTPGYVDELERACLDLRRSCRMESTITSLSELGRWVRVYLRPVRLN